MNRVVITGIGMLNAVGNDKSSSFKSLIDAECGIDKITLFDKSMVAVDIAGEVKNFDLDSLVSEMKEIKRMDRFIQIGIKASIEAMNDSNIDLNNTNLDTFGVSTGSGIGGLPLIEQTVSGGVRKGFKKVSPFFIPGALINLLSGIASIKHGLKGPNIASVTACAAGTHSIIESYKTIVCGGASKMLSIASESSITASGIAGFASMKALSNRCDDPKHASRPFDKDRNGFVMGEGAASLVLENYEDARARGAKIYGEIIGYGESGDAHHITTPAPGGDGGYRAMAAAVKMAGISPADIDYINAHGTSTYYNDYYETMAIKKLYEKEKNIPPISSIKGHIGHCLGAAGGIEAVTCLMAMEQGVLPPTINQTERDENCDLFYIPNEAIKKDANIVMSNSFGFGGTNASILIKKV